MPDAVMFNLGWVAIAAILGLMGAVVARGRIGWGWLLAALVSMAAYDALLTRGFGHIPIDFGPSEWNWEGKALAIALSLALASLPFVGWRRAGLTPAQDSRGLPGALVLCGLLVALFVGLAIYLPGEGSDPQAMAFQLTMPGLDEEIFYRGVLLLMLNEAFGRPIRVLGAPMGWGAVVSSVAFGLAHGLGYSDGAFTFDAMLTLATGGPALLLVWLREKTGSVLLPILMHNFANTIFMVI